MDVEANSTQQFEAKILYLIGRYSNLIDSSDSTNLVFNLDKGDKWVKELPLMCLCYELIVKGILDYDYSPQSILITNYRRIANISQECIDDINDMRELELIEKLQLTTKHHTIINGYRLTVKGFNALRKMDPKEKKHVDELICCTDDRCNALKEVKIISTENKRTEDWYDLGEEKLAFVLACAGDKAHVYITSDFLETEDVSYISRAYYLKDFL